MYMNLLQDLVTLFCLFLMAVDFIGREKSWREDILYWIFYVACVVRFIIDVYTNRVNFDLLFKMVYNIFN